MSSPPIVFSVVGRSGSGKTTLITKLIPFFVARGLKVGSIKHTHHDVELDKKGKDSWKHKQAGSSQVMLLTHGKMALFGEYDPASSLRSICDRWFLDYDLVVSEGFKNESCFKIEICRQQNNKPPLYLDPRYHIQAVVSDFQQTCDVPVFDINSTEELFEWLLPALKLS